MHKFYFRKDGLFRLLPLIRSEAFSSESPEVQLLIYKGTT